VTLQRSPAAGSRDAALHNLLDACIGLKKGDRLLIVGEPDESFYRGALAAIAAKAARYRGAEVELVEAGPIQGPEHFPDGLKALIAAADHTLFFSRIGAAARFLRLPGPGAKVVSYTLDHDSFSSLFASLPYPFLQELHDAIVERIALAKRYRLTCPNGSDLAMELEPGSGAGARSPLTPFAVRNFPLMIVPPISAARAEGRVVLTLALLSTSTHVYENPVLPLTSPLTLTVQGGRIVDFAGEPELVHRVIAHFDRVGDLFGGDPRSFSSWHAGVNPGTFFAADAISDLERWGNVAFGSPRYTHFHMVGGEPGDICGSLFDATISFDDEAIWRDGKLAFLDGEEGRRLIARHGVDRRAIAEPLPIGV